MKGERSDSARPPALSCTVFIGQEQSVGTGKKDGCCPDPSVYPPCCVALVSLVGHGAAVPLCYRCRCRWVVPQLRGLGAAVQMEREGLPLPQRLC